MEFNFTPFVQILEQAFLNQSHFWTSPRSTQVPAVRQTICLSRLSAYLLMLFLYPWLLSLYVFVYVSFPICLLYLLLFFFHLCFISFFVFYYSQVFYLLLFLLSYPFFLVSLPLWRAIISDSMLSPLSLSRWWRGSWPAWFLLNLPGPGLAVTMLSETDESSDHYPASGPQSYCSLFFYIVIVHACHRERTFSICIYISIIHW